MQVISTNCMIARRSSSPSRSATRCSSGLNCSRTATPAPTATATIRSDSTANGAADGEHQSAAISVVVPGSGSFCFQRSRVE